MLEVKFHILFLSLNHSIIRIVLHYQGEKIIYSLTVETDIFVTNARHTFRHF